TPVSKPDVVSTKMDCLSTVLAEGTPASAKSGPFTNSENRAVPRTSASAVTVAKPTPKAPAAVDTNLRASPPASVKGTVFPLPTAAPVASTKPALNGAPAEVVSLIIPVPGELPTAAGFVMNIVVFQETAAVTPSATCGK